jgi:predicted transcriptional regulator
MRPAVFVFVSVPACRNYCVGVTLVTPINKRRSIMPTTSLKLSDQLKQRAAAAAERQGLSSHAFMVRAIEQAAAAAERRAGFVGEAQAAREQMLQSGEGYDAVEVHAYLKARIAGADPVKPKAKSWQG